MARPKQITITPIDDDNNIAATQTPAAGGVQSLTLISDPVTFDTPHKLIITAAANDSGRVFTITGKAIGGQPTTETLAGPNATTAESVNYWIEVSDIAVDDDTAGAIIVGTSGLCSSPWIPSDYRAHDFGIAFGCQLSTGGAMTYTVQHTFDDLQALGADITTFNHDSVAGKTASEDGNYAFPPRGIRTIISAFTSGSLNFSIIEKV